MPWKSKIDQYSDLTVDLVPRVVAAALGAFIGKQNKNGIPPAATKVIEDATRYAYAKVEKETHAGGNALMSVDDAITDVKNLLFPPKPDPDNPFK